MTVDLERFRDDGFLILRGFFAPEHYRALARDLAQRLALLEKHHGADPGPLDDEMAGLSARLIRLERWVPGAQRALYDAMNGAPALHRLATDYSLLATVRALLSPTVALHHRFIVLMSMPGDEWHLPVWHQDWFYNRGPASTLTVWAPLQRVDAQNGALLLAPGACRRGFIEHAEHDHGVRTKWVSLPPDAVSAWRGTVSADLDVGDVLVMNSLVPHSARLNRSEHVRFVINLRYQDLADPEFIAAGWRVASAAEARSALARPMPVCEPQSGPGLGSPALEASHQMVCEPQSGPGLGSPALEASHPMLCEPQSGPGLGSPALEASHQEEVTTP